MRGTGLRRPGTFTASLDAAVRLATSQLEKGDRAAAESVALQILEADPEQPDALHICGALAHLSGKNGLALALLEQAARRAPLNAQIHYNLGVVYGALERAAQAEAHYRQVLVFEPGHVHAMRNLGNLAFAQGALDEALAMFRAVLQRSPHHPQLNLALAMTHAARRDLADARVFFERALELDADDAMIRWEAAQFFLLVGEYARGWDLYEARFPAGPSCKVWCYPYPYPRWQGEPLAGRHLLVHGEQGLGDEIMFLSILPELLEEGARVTLVGQPYLHALWRDVFPEVRCYAQLRANDDAWLHVEPEWLDELAASAVDFQVPFGSLPGLRRRDPADFRRQRPYIRADARRSASWGAWLDKRLPKRGPKRLRVGVVWSGNAQSTYSEARRKDALRSLAPEALAPLTALANVHWVSVQAWQGARQSPCPAGVVDAAQRLSDFRETAALLDQLDLVVSVDTAVCHLAGAMGKPVWILLPYAGEWRWGLDATSTVWWPGARLFRQETMGDWAGVIERVRSALLEMLA